MGCGASSTGASNVFPAPDDPAPQLKQSVPLQMNRLPKGRLHDVNQALQVLKRAGITSVADVEALKGKVDALERHRIGYCSAYTRMNLWAWTPRRWGMAERPDIAKACELEGKKDQEGNDQNGCGAEALQVERMEDWKKKVQAVIPDLMETRFAKGLEHGRSACQRHIEKLEMNNEESKSYRPNAAEHFERFLQAKIFNTAELRLMKDCTKTVRLLGNGSSVFFQATKSSDAFKPKDRVRKPGREPGQAAAKRTQNIVFAHVGGFGCGVGSSLWSRLDSEHKLGPDGKHTSEGAYGDVHVCYHEEGGSFRPRAVLVDGGQGNIVPGLQQGSRFSAASLVSNEGNYQNGCGAEAVCACGETLEQAKDAFRKQAEASDFLSSIVLTHSTFGGFGAGLGGNIVEHFRADYGKKVIWTVSLVPDGSDAEGPRGATPMYDSLLTLKTVNDAASAVILVDNKAMHAACAGGHGRGLNIADPKHSDYNDLTARVLAGMTSSLRIATCASASQFSQRLNLNAAVSNLVPYPSLNFISAAFGPLFSEDMIPLVCGPERKLVAQALSKPGQLNSLDMRTGKFMSSCLYGRNLSNHDLVKAIAAKKSQREFQVVDWCPTGFSSGCHTDSSVAFPEVTWLFAHTGIMSVLDPLLWKFDEVYAERVDVARLIDTGVEEGAISEAREEMAGKTRGYEEVGVETAGDEEEY
eukprot:TRINITY_DN17895_c0_g1_i1.p1 TRINITY_DN17895_c0_g1~~TRINITY_DN17895_c0_g1_i1.p1  ORF type:complete len:696 (+),score=125.90 TRINITY_DN17895_c0_g1_i1:122-2209(+)